MNYDLFLPVRLITGRGCVRENAGKLAALGDKCLLVTGRGGARKSGALEDVTAALDAAGVAHRLYDGVEPNPTLASGREAADLAREWGAQFLVGIGGGSALDAAKAAAVYAANDMELMEIYDLNWKNPPLPLVLVGTTAGTGSEVGPVAVMTTPQGRKRSFVSEAVYPALTFGDPAYTDTVPPRFTRSTALDALCHAVEGYFSTAANELSDLFARQAVSMLLPQLRALADRGEGDLPAHMRDTLYYASVVAGFTLARCGTCYCHNLGYYLTEECDTPHGFACAVFLSDFLRRAQRLLPEKARRLWEAAGCDERELCALVDTLCERPRLRMQPGEIRRLAESCGRSGNALRTAPHGYTAAEAEKLLTQLFGEC